MAYLGSWIQPAADLYVLFVGFHILGRTAYVTRSVGSKKEGVDLLREVRKSMLQGLYAAPQPKITVEGMTIEHALDAVLPTCRMSYALADGVLTVGAEPAAPRR